jgi:DNA-binding transcriptional ArsR family regulator
MTSRFELLVHPVRLQILHAFGTGDKALTHDELVTRLRGMPPDRLETHLRILVDNGIVSITGEGPDLRYRVIPEERRIQPADVLKATPADHLRYFTTFVAGLIDNFARCTRHLPFDPVNSGTSYRQVTLYLTTDELQRVVDEFETIFSREIENPSGGDRKPMVVTRIIMPEAPLDEGP